MADNAARVLRDGALPGEFAPALMLLHRSSHTSYAATSLLLHFLRTLCSQIAAATAQAHLCVLVVTERSPQAYLSSLDSRGQWNRRLYIVDCYNDPLGWRECSNNHAIKESETDDLAAYNMCNNLTDLTYLFSLITNMADVLPDKDESVKVSVVIDSVSTLLRYNSISSVTQFLNSLRSCGGVSSILWLMHAGLHDARVVSSLEYVASMVALIEQNENRISWKTSKGTNSMYVLRLRQKRRNGRFKEQVDDFDSDNFEVKIYTRKVATEPVKAALPIQVQFKLELSEKERTERAKVILPYEHQGNGRESLIYDGRQITQTEDKSPSCETGEVNYIRDSDDEKPDSDEDPDDDLDI